MPKPLVHKLSTWYTFVHRVKLLISDGRRKLGKALKELMRAQEGLQTESKGEVRKETILPQFMPSTFSVP